MTLLPPGLDWDEMSRIERLALLDPAEREELIADLTLDDLKSSEMTLRRTQLDVVRSDEWVTVLAGGRGAGKTKTGAHWVIERAQERPGCVIALLGRTVADVRDVMIGGDSGIVASSPSTFEPVYTPSLRKLEWPNGSVAYTYSSDSPSQLRGPQQAYAWADELAAYRMIPDDSGATAWDNLMLSTRLGERPQLLVTTTPKRVSVIRELFRLASEPGSGVVLYAGSTLSNRANLSASYIQAIHDRYAGTALERQELYGELVGDSPGALWRSADISINPCRLGLDSLITVVGVDPSVSRHGDDAGIVVVSGTKEPNPMDRKGWVREDLTINGAPDVWAKIVVEAQERWSTPGNPAIVVVEGNQGGELLNLVLNQLSPGIPIALTHAIRSKAARADPVVMAYRQSRVFHDADFVDLVDELTGWEPDVSRWSPGHLDAMVWAAHTLLVDSRPLARFAPILVSNRTDLPGPSMPLYRSSKGVGMSRVRNALPPGITGGYR